MIKYTLHIILLLIVQSTAAQQTTNFFHSLKPVQGSIYSNTSCFTQDRLGYLWIGTQYGLVQYDGFTATTFLKNNSGNSLSDNFIYSLYADEGNNVYIGTGTGLCRYDIVTKRFHAYRSMQTAIQDIRAGEQGNLWIASARGLLFCKAGTDTLLAYTVKQNGQPVNTGAIRQLAWHSPFIYAASASSGVIRINTLTDEVRIFNQQQQLAGNEALGVCCDKEGNVWVVSDRIMIALQKIDHGERVSDSYFHYGNNNASFLSNNFIYLLCDNSGKLWLNSISNGITSFDPQTKSFTDNLSGKYRPGLSITQYHTRSFQDRSGIIWVGTSGFGVEYFQPSPEFFTNITYSKDNPNSLTDEWGRCALQVDDEQVWLATAGGNSIYNLQTGKCRNLKNTEKQKFFHSNSIRSLCMDTEKNIWIGTADGLNRYNAATKRFEFFDTANGIPQSFFWSIIQTSSGQVMASSPAGVFVYANGHFEDFFRTHHLDKYRKNIVYQMEDSRQRIWFITSNWGIMLYDPGKNSITELSNETTPGLLPGNRNNSINEDAQGNIWIGGFGGLIRYDPRTGESKRYDTAIGVADGWVASVLFDNSNRLWATTTSGLLMIDPATNFLKKFTAADGLPAGGFNGQRDIALKDGRFLLASHSGFTLFNPNDYSERTESFPFYISSFSAGEPGVMQFPSMEEKGSLSLEPDQNFFSMHFAAPVFDENEKIFFSYKLDGFDKDWITTQQRDVNYTNVPGGDYVFRYRAGTNPLSWAMKEKMLLIHIGTPFYKTWWFRILAVLLLAALIFLYYRSRLKAHRNLQEEKIKVAKLNAEKYKSRLEMEQVINYFTTSLVDKHQVDDALWDVARNLIGQLGFEDCMIYLWNEERTKMVQKAGYGPKGSLDEIKKQPFDVVEGQGVVGYVMKYKEPVIIPDTSVDPRYRPDEMTRLSEITVPIIYNDELIGIIDSEHQERNFFTEDHLQIMITIAAMLETKIHDINSQQSLQQAQKEKAEMEYETLKQHLNPHFLFNSLASVIGLIKTDPKLAVEFIRNLNGVYRYVLQNKDEQLVTLKAELDFVNRYFQLQKTRFGNGLEISISTTEEMMNKKIVPVTLQNLLENAIKHNSTDSDSPLHIDIFASNGFLHVRNNLQLKSFVETSNRQGLKSLKLLYSFLSDKAVETVCDEKYFTVIIPLL